MLRYRLLASLGTPFLLILALATQDTAGGHRAGQHPETMGPEQAAHLFAARCRNCHTVPDPRFATDRAWLTQIQDTA